MDDVQVTNEEEQKIPAPENDAEESARPQAEAVPIEPTESTAEPVVAPEAEVAAGPKRYWYVVHCYSGYEKKVEKGLLQRISSMGMHDSIFRVIVPTEEERRVFPGYIMVEMIQYNQNEPKSQEAWYVVRNTPGVTGFVSSSDKPVPLRDDEVAKILKRMDSEQPKVRVTYKTGQAVHIIDGPFADFRGTVDEVNMEKGKVRVMVSMFGRETPVELDLLQVEKV